MPSGDSVKPDLMDFDDYAGRFDVAASLFRFQVHPVYTVQREQEAFRKFLDTGEREIDFGNDMFKRIRARRESGRTAHRVYLIKPPLTDYQRFVFISYHHYAEAGEDLRIIDTSRTTNPGLPDYDFVLLNDETVIKVHYASEDGAWIGPELLADADPAQYIHYKDLALAHSIPFLEYEKTLDD